MALDSFVLDPGVSLSAVAPREGQLRRDYLQLDAVRVDEPGARPVLRVATLRLRPAADVPDVQTRTARRVVRRTALVLELMLVAAFTAEALDEAGVSSSAEFPGGVNALRAVVRRRAQRDPIAVLARTVKGLRIPETEFASAAPAASGVSLAAVVRWIEGWLVSCPITGVERLAKGLGMPKWGNRCRVAYDALQAFLQRRSPEAPELLCVLGPHYRDGTFTATEVATVLKVDVPTAVAMLEQHGYGRAPQTIRLRDGQRDEILAAMRADRLRRRAQPQSLAHLARRSAIASSRIENVDARAWLTSRDTR